MNISIHQQIAHKPRSRLPPVRSSPFPTNILLTLPHLARPQNKADQLQSCLDIFSSFRVAEDGPRGFRQVSSSIKETLNEAQGEELTLSQEIVVDLPRGFSLMVEHVQHGGEHSDECDIGTKVESFGRVRTCGEFGSGWI